VGGENSRVPEDQSTEKIFRRRQAGPSSDPAQKARLARTQWLPATADCERNSRTHPRRTALPATDDYYPVARHAIAHTLHQVEATLRYRLLQRAAASQPPRFLPFGRTGDRPSL